MLDSLRDVEISDLRKQCYCRYEISTSLNESSIEKQGARGRRESVSGSGYFIPIPCGRAGPVANAVLKSMT
jgi:hypothetical protein